MGRFWISLARGHSQPWQPPTAALKTRVFDGVVADTRLLIAVETDVARTLYSSGRLLAYVDCADFSQTLADSKDSMTRSDRIQLSLDDLQVIFEENTGKLEIQVPLVCTQAVFARAETDRLTVCTDPRLLQRPGDAVDPHGMFSLLQFGTLSPPFSPWTSIERLRPGYCHTIDISRLRTDRVKVDFWNPPCATQRPPATDSNSRLDRIAEELDRQIDYLAPDRAPVILYSGGVDSSLIAAQVKTAGMNGRLFHYSFGDDTGETRLAREMAGHIGLPLDVVSDSNDRTEAMLAAIGATYPFPFTDHSCLPTYLLCKAALDRVDDSKYFLDGTGADGDFAIFGKVLGWKKVYSVPKLIRKAAALAYARRSIWKTEGRVEYLGRLLSRSARLPLLLGGPLAVNSLDGIAYRFETAVRDRVVGELESWFDDSLTGLDDDQRYCAVDLIQICCNVFCQKSRPVFESTNRRVGYPFLTASMVRLALLEAIAWPRRGERKELLKDLLARHVPPELVFRKKTPFVAPLAEKFATPAMQAALREHVLSKDNPLSPWLIREALEPIVESAKSGQRFPSPVNYFLWGALFGSLWLTQNSHHAPS